MTILSNAKSQGVLFSMMVSAVFGVGILSLACTQDNAGSRIKEAKKLEPKADKEADVIPDPLQVRFANDENIAMAKKIAEIAKDVKPTDAPEYVKKMVEHLKNVTRIFKENVDDCDKTAAALKKYVEDHKADLQAIRKEGDEAQAKMSEEQKSKLSTQTILLLGPIAKDLALAQAHFVTNCRQQADDIADAMQAVVGD